MRGGAVHPGCEGINLDLGIGRGDADFLVNQPHFGAIDLAHRKATVTPAKVLGSRLNLSRPPTTIISYGFREFDDLGVKYLCLDCKTHCCLL